MAVSIGASGGSGIAAIVTQFAITRIPYMNCGYGAKFIIALMMSSVKRYPVMSGLLWIYCINATHARAGHGTAGYAVCA
jgi:hypothetical protein